MKRYRFLVSGKVQGVGFRYHVQHEANRRHLTGLVRNLPDGRVHVEIQGDYELILDLRHYMAHDLPFARVSDIEMTELEPVVNEVGFKVRY